MCSSDLGTFSYQWHRVGTGALSDGAYISGSQTTTLTLSNVLSPDDHLSQYYFVATHIPSAYGNPGIGAGRSTGNAINGPTVTSNTATLTVYPVLTLNTQPQDATITINNNTTFSVNASVTDTTQGSISYQWFLNGNAVSDGVIQTTSSVATFTQTYTSDTTITIPDDATNIQIRISAGAGGYGGTDEGTGNAGGGTGR